MGIKSLRVNAALCLWILICGVVLSGCGYTWQEVDRMSGKAPRIYPDYSGVVFPLNIAPPNFVIQEEGERFQAAFGYDGKVDFVCGGSNPEIIIPEDKWKELTEQAAGQEIFIRIAVRQNGSWTGFTDIRDTVSQDPIDPYLVYRLLYPGYELWNEMGIYQRDLTGYEEFPILENKDFGKQCLNCHTFNHNSPDEMMIHVRGKDGGTLIRRNGTLEKVSASPQGAAHGSTYPAWHPSGKYIAYSMNEIQQFFHANGQKPIEVSDLAADLGVYDVVRHEMLTDSLIYGDGAMETFPAWSPDGRTLYFCRGNAYHQGAALDSLRYDLCSIDFDPETGRFGDRINCLYEASAKGKSVSFPRVSPDGRYLLFTQSDYGNFSIWHPESDLYLLELANGKIHELPSVNSKDVDSFHTWSSSGKWFVFSSKRLDGLWARPFFAHFDPTTGQASKPFLLPQKDPHFYETFTRTYNLPELVKAPVSDQKALLQTVFSTNVVTTLKKQ